MNVSMNDLQDRTALITGAPSGLGREFALLCAAVGMRPYARAVGGVASRLRDRLDGRAEQALGRAVLTWPGTGRGR